MFVVKWLESQSNWKLRKKKTGTLPNGLSFLFLIISETYINYILSSLTYKMLNKYLILKIIFYIKILPFLN